jgi:hypothetical protein
MAASPLSTGSSAQAAASDAIKQAEVQQEIRTNIGPMSHFKKYDKRVFEPGEFDFIERNMVRMRMNKLLDREEWKRKIHEAKKAWGAVTQVFYMKVLMFLCAILAIILVIVFTAACIEFYKNEEKNVHLRQLMFIWLPLVFAVLSVRFFF